ncbi:MAG TPA: 23S rRNA (guanosine(2251)-2'-O)-methyltransferase RlmB [Candidatus Hydrogenedens sp.]|nr:23S rRNA (guanosine(2251)-2'-O)-methyltransferase RlmB [Candidatus Hydrogenedens sp.]
MQKENIIYGRIPVLTCLKAESRAVYKIYIQEGVSIPELKEWQNCIPIEIRPRGFLDHITKNAVHQGIVAEVENLHILSWNEWLQNSMEGLAKQIVVLDHIEDPRNLGAIIRSAVAFNINTIILPHEGSAPITPITVKASAGAVEYAQIVQVKSILQSIRKLKEIGYSIYALDAQGDKKLNELIWQDKSVIIIGSEGKGIRSLLKRECNYLVSIPTGPKIYQLNASVSASIAFYTMSTSKKH